MANDHRWLFLVKAHRQNSRHTLFGVLVVFAVLVVTFAHATAPPPRTPVVIQMIPLPTSGNYANISLDQALNVIYSSGYNSASEAVQVMLINGLNFTTTQPSGVISQEVGVNPLTDEFWTASVYNGLNIYSGMPPYPLEQTLSLSLGGCPISAQYDFLYNRMWVVAQCGNPSGSDPVYAFNATTHAPEAAFKTGYINGGGLLNSANGILYVGTASPAPPGLCLRYDPKNFKPDLPPTWFTNGCPWAPDPVHNLLYYVDNNGSCSAPNTTLYILNGGNIKTSETVEKTISLPYYANNVMDVNNAIQHLYTVGGCTQNGFVMDIRNSLTGAPIIQFPLDSSVTQIQNVVADALRGRIYVVVLTTGAGPCGGQQCLYILDDISTVGKAVPGTGGGTTGGHS